jgi:hypothetical protein
LRGVSVWARRVLNGPFGGFRPGQIAACAKSFAAGFAPAVAGGCPWLRCTDYCRVEMAKSLAAGKLVVR